MTQGSHLRIFKGYKKEFRGLNVALIKNIKQSKDIQRVLKIIDNQEEQIPTFLYSYSSTFLPSYIHSFLHLYIHTFLYSIIPSFHHSFLLNLINNKSGNLFGGDGQTDKQRNNNCDI